MDYYEQLAHGAGTANEHLYGPLDDPVLYARALVAVGGQLEQYAGRVLESVAALNSAYEEGAGGEALAAIKGCAFEDASVLFNIIHRLGALLEHPEIDGRIHKYLLLTAETCTPADQ